MNRFRKVTSWINKHRRESIIIALVLAVSVLAHAWNMFGYPYIENDEATYTSRAWAFATEGQLDVYTYRYDHAPLGWMFIGIWQLLTGGSHLFGSLISSGRVLMLVLHLFSSILLYVLAKRFSGGSKLAAVVAVGFFSLSPLALYFQRRILLDNIMTFWLLVSLYFATMPKQRLKYYLLSAITFGLSVLTKLNIIFVAPAILYLVWKNSHKDHKLHAAAYWTVVTGMIIACFFVYALLKGELLPAPLDSAGNPERVSVADTFSLQLGRGDFAWPWQAHSSFMQNAKSWILKDWSILAAGAISTIALTFVGIKRRKTQPYLLSLVAIVWLYVAFLARGKIVLDLYVVPLLPFMGLVTGVVVSVIYKDWLKTKLLRRVATAGFIAAIPLLIFASPKQPYYLDETTNQQKAVQWVSTHVPKDAVIATDNYVYPYLAQEQSYTNVSYFFNTEYDPEVRESYADDWRNIEYLVLTHEIVKQIKTGTVPRMKLVLDHSELLADFREGASSYIDLPNYISTNGDWAQVYKIKDRNSIVLQDSWKYFKSKFVVDYGQVIDLTNNSLSTSASQAQGMLRAVAMNDESTFQGLWQWSKDHLRYRANDKLLSWKWEKKPDGTYALADSNNVCDADQMVAYALFKADEKWRGRKYVDEGIVHLESWWKECTFVRNGQRYVDSSADGSQDIRLLNLGYFRPEIYHYFKEYYSSLPWDEVLAGGYALINRAHAIYGTIPNWVILTPTGALESAVPYIGQGADSFGFDALQLVPHLVEDYKKYGDIRSQQALGLLEASTSNLATTGNQPSKIAEILLLQARINGSQPPQTAQRLYDQVIYSPYKINEGYWYDGNNYLDHSWFWRWHDLQTKLALENQVVLR